MKKGKEQKGGHRVSPTDNLKEKELSEPTGDLEGALKALTSVKLDGRERDLILNPPIYEEVAGDKR